MEFFRQNLLWIALLAAGASFLVVDQQVAPSADMKAAFKISHEIADSVVLVKRDEGGGGSGTVIYQDDSEAHILTCNHVIAGVKKITISWHNGMYDEEITADAQVMSFDATRDYAILKTKPVWRGVARVITERQYAYEFSIYVRCIVLGYPATIGLEDPFVRSPHMTEGYVSDLHERQYMRISAPITYGNSGSGVFVMLDGHWTMVGMVQAVKTVDLERGHPLCHIGLCFPPVPLMECLKD